MFGIQHRSSYTQIGIGKLHGRVSELLLSTKGFAAIAEIAAATGIDANIIGINEVSKSGIVENMQMIAPAPSSLTAETGAAQVYNTGVKYNHGVVIQQAAEDKQLPKKRQRSLSEENGVIHLIGHNEKDQYYIDELEEIYPLLVSKKNKDLEKNVLIVKSSDGRKKLAKEVAHYICKKHTEGFVYYVDRDNFSDYIRDLFIFLEGPLTNLGKPDKMHTYIHNTLRSHQGFVLVFNAINSNEVKNFCSYISDLNGTVIICDENNPYKFNQIDHFNLGRRISLAIEYFEKNIICREKYEKFNFYSIAINTGDSPELIKLIVGYINAEENIENIRTYINDISRHANHAISSFIANKSIKKLNNEQKKFLKIAKLIKVYEFPQIVVNKILRKEDIEDLIFLNIIRSNGNQYYEVNEAIFVGYVENSTIAATDSTKLITEFVKEISGLIDDSPYSEDVNNNTAIYHIGKKIKNYFECHNLINENDCKIIIEDLLAYINFYMEIIYVDIRSGRYEEAYQQLIYIKKMLNMVSTVSESLFQYEIEKCEADVSNAMAWLSIDAAWDKERILTENICKNLNSALRFYRNHYKVDYNEHLNILHCHSAMLARILNEQETDGRLKAICIAENIAKQYEINIQQKGSRKTSYKNEKLAPHRCAQAYIILSRTYHDLAITGNKNYYNEAKEWAKKAIEHLRKHDRANYICLIYYYLEAASIAIDSKDFVNADSFIKESEYFFNELKVKYMNQDMKRNQFQFVFIKERIKILINLMRLNYIQKTNKTLKANRDPAELEIYDNMNWIFSHEVYFPRNFIKNLQMELDNLISNIYLQNEIDSMQLDERYCNILKTNNKISIIGESGVGKSNLAKQLAMKFDAGTSGCKRLIWLVDCRTELTFYDSFVKLSMRLNLDSKRHPSENFMDFIKRIILQIKDKLYEFKNILIIYDNVSETELVEKYENLLETNATHLDKTSIYICNNSQKILNKNSHKIFLAGVTFNDANRYIENKLRDQKKTKELLEKLAPEENATFIKPIPLAIATEYLSIRGDSILRIKDNSLANIIRECLNGMDKYTISLLTFACLVNPNAILFSMLTAFYKNQKKTETEDLNRFGVSDVYAYETVTAMLSTCCGLIKCAAVGYTNVDDVYSMHTVIQDAIWKIITEENDKEDDYEEIDKNGELVGKIEKVGKNILNEVAAVLYTLACSKEYEKNRQKINILITNIEYFLQKIKNIQPALASKELDNLILILGYRYYVLERYDESIADLANLFSKNTSLDKENPFYYKAMEGLAWSYYHTGEYRKSLEIFNRALLEKSQKYGEQSEEFYRVLICRAQILRGVGFFNDSLCDANKAKSIGENLNNQLLLAEAHQYMAYAYFYQGCEESAGLYCEKSLDTKINNAGLTAACADDYLLKANIAFFILLKSSCHENMQGLLQEALSDIAKSLRLIKDNYGKVNYRLVNSYFVKGNLCIIGKDYSSAIKKLNNALEISIVSYSNIHYKKINIYISLIYAYIKNGEIAKAVSLRKTLLGLASDIIDKYDVGDTKEKIIDLYHKANKESKAPEIKFCALFKLFYEYRNAIYKEWYYLTLFTSFMYNDIKIINSQNLQDQNPPCPYNRVHPTS